MESSALIWFLSWKRYHSATIISWHDFTHINFFHLPKIFRSHSNCTLPPFPFLHFIMSSPSSSISANPRYAMPWFFTHLWGSRDNPSGRRVIRSHLDHGGRSSWRLLLLPQSFGNKTQCIKPWVFSFFGGEGVGVVYRHWCTCVLVHLYLPTYRNIL